MSENEVNWAEQVTKEIQKIKEWVLSDRLSIVSKLMFMNGALASSVTGWNSWLTNPLVMELLSEEQLRNVVSEFEKLTIGFLELDLKCTKMAQEKQKENKSKLEANKSHAKKKEQSHAKYVT